jgi:hypothetical protein
MNRFTLVALLLAGFSLAPRASADTQNLPASNPLSILPSAAAVPESTHVSLLGTSEQSELASIVASPALDSRFAGAELSFQPPNPADQSHEKPAEPGGRVPTYELPALTVEGQPSAALREEELVGPYGQPRWTTMRRFPFTRVYVIPEGAIEVEYWYRSTLNRDHKDEARMLGEVEVGLPYRFQLDVYFRTDQDDAGSAPQYGQQIELRWALADWGKIWGNPTLYLEYINLEGRPDRVEPKLLLGGDITERWHWGANFVTEWEINGSDRAREYEFDGGISYSLIDSKLSLGMETKLNLTDHRGSRGHFDEEYYLGPSIQWKPFPRMTVNIAPLIGLTNKSPYAQMTFNVGWEF